VVLSRDLTAWHTTTALDQSILVRTDGTAAARQALTALVVSRPGLVLDSSDAGPGGVGGTPPEVWVNLAVLAVLLGYLLLGIANKTSKAIAPVGPSRLLFSCVVTERRDSHCHRGAADWSDTESCDQPAQRDAHLGEFVGGLLGLGNTGGGDLGRGRYPGDVVSDLPAASRGGVDVTVHLAGRGGLLLDSRRDRGLVVANATHGLTDLGDRRSTAAALRDL
jgi:hypothetical protein